MHLGVSAGKLLLGGGGWRACLELVFISLNDTPTEPMLDLVHPKTQLLACIEMTILLHLKYAVILTVNIMPPNLQNTFIFYSRPYETLDPRS